MAMMPPEMMGGFGMSEAPPEAAAPEGGGSATDYLRGAIELAQMAMQAEGDDQFSQEIAKGISIFYKIMATLQKESEAAQGVTPQHKFMARQNAGGGGNGGY